MPKNISMVIFTVLLMSVVANSPAATATWDTLFYDDFSTEKGWTFSDPFTQKPYWHKDSIGAYSGQSWWCGTAQDTAGWYNPPGYGDGWVQYLITPNVDLTTITSDSVIFSFIHFYSVEQPSPGYDWDCCNLWASVDSGKTWLIQMPDTMRHPASKYNIDNSYAWQIAGLASDSIAIPGWGGTNGTWDIVMFDLTPLKGANILVRFAFVSDLLMSDQTDGNYHGAWYIDNVKIDTVSAGGISSAIFYDDTDTDSLTSWETKSKILPYYWHKICDFGNWIWVSGDSITGNTLGTKGKRWCHLILHCLRMQIHAQLISALYFQIP